MKPHEALRFRYGQVKPHASRSDIISPVDSHVQQSLTDTDLVAGLAAGNSS